MLTNLAFVFICVRASSAFVRTSAFLQPVVRGQVYNIFEISPPLIIIQVYMTISGGIVDELYPTRPHGSHEGGPHAQDDEQGAQNHPVP